MPTAVIATATLSSLAGSPTKVEHRRNRRPRLTPPSPPPYRYPFARPARRAYIGGMTSPTDPRRFLYRADALDPDLAQRLARDALAKADDGELYLQYRPTESFSFADGRLKPAAYSTPASFGLRAASGRRPSLPPAP